ncbi:hypothetical protein HPB50_012761 [Hyalomma asiaticum]|uniref:Uncharacterized protein n=1 Tax=Hyalomma asiaticum TaxID=266040 RepID=A0ACB7TH80_HYAAI|nr:hypothetical protein HPB50_012761 [Hyalomma asiaticum]
MVDTVITVKLQRGEGTSWGFRLAGGKDFGYPLSVQRPEKFPEKRYCRGEYALFDFCKRDSPRLSLAFVFPA